MQGLIGRSVRSNWYELMFLALFVLYLMAH
jgi:hypothetical protein